MIIKEDSDGHVATAQSAVRQILTLIDGSTKIVDFPDLETSPVHFAGGGGVTRTHPVKKGDEGMVALMAAPQDLWHDKGGVQDPIDGAPPPPFGLALHPGRAHDRLPAMKDPMIGVRPFDVSDKLVCRANPGLVTGHDFGGAHDSLGFRGRDLEPGVTANEHVHLKDECAAFVRGAPSLTQSPNASWNNPRRRS